MTTNASDPSRLFCRNLCRPNGRPIRAPAVSLTIRTVNAVMVIALGKIRMQKTADRRTKVAPFIFGFSAERSCGRRMGPNQRRKIVSIFGARNRTTSVTSASAAAGATSMSIVSRVTKS